MTNQAPLGPVPSDLYHPAYAYGERWKCPDCHGWVLNSVMTHYCSPIYSTTANKFVFYSFVDDGDSDGG
jgi:hypothetical protein